MTAGMHHRWRARAVDLAAVGPGLAGARRGHRHGRPGDRAARPRRRGRGDGLLRADARARARQGARTSASRRGNALDLPYADGEFDAVTVGFGARNFSDLGQGLAEMARVTRPGGRVVVLEITTPQKPPLSWFFRLWFDQVVPRLGPARRRPGRLHLPPELRAPLPGARGAGRGAGRGRPDGRALGAHGGRHHRPPRRTRGDDRAPRRSSARCSPRAGAPLAARARAHRGAARRGGGRPRRRSSTSMPPRCSRRAASGCGRCSSS